MFRKIIWVVIKETSKKRRKGEIRPIKLKIGCKIPFARF